MDPTQRRLFYSNNADFSDHTTGELAKELTLLAGQINAATYYFLKMLAEFDRREG